MSEMQLTEKLWSECPNGVTCEGTWATDAGGKVYVLKDARRLSAADVARLELPVGEGEFALFIPDEQDGTR